LKSPADTDSFLSEDGRVEVVFDLEVLGNLAESQVELVMRAAVAGLDSEQFEGPDHITVMITGDEQIRALNRDFKGEDEITDVLSFNADGDAGDDEGDGDWLEFTESDESDGSDVPGGDQKSLKRLGDIAISLPQVVRQAVENGKSADRELAMLTIHGVLHLLGYDHAEVDEEKVMFGKTDVVLAGIFGE
jgi:probable rRNA maturation factor